MKHISYINPKSKKPVHQVELTKGEQYQLMKENIQLLAKQDINWQNIFADTVSYADFSVTTD